MTLPSTSAVGDTSAATPTFDVWVSNQPVDFYVSLGSFPEAVMTTDFEDSGNINATVEGYTVSLP